MVQWTSSLPPSLTGRLSKHTHLSYRVHPPLVGWQLSLEGLVFLQLALQVGWVTVGLIWGCLQLLTDPSIGLERDGEHIWWMHGELNYMLCRALAFIWKHHCSFLCMELPHSQAFPPPHLAFDHLLCIWAIYTAYSCGFVDRQRTDHSTHMWAG